MGTAVRVASVRAASIRATLALALLLASLHVAVAQTPGPQSADRDFYSPSNRLLEIAKPIRTGLDEFRARLDAVRTGAGREPLGLVLSGGSARAYAHIGVLRVLESEGIIPDFIVANSMGALIGGLYAAGCSPDSMERLFGRFPAETLFDPVLPMRGGFLNSARFTALIRALVGDLDLGSLPIPIIVTAEDLESRRRAEFASGDLAELLAASSALPVFFEPARIGGMTLIDGGIANLVPVALAGEFSRAVVVSATLSDRPQDFTNPFVVVNRAIDIGKTRTALEDLSRSGFPIIRNDVESMPFIAFSGVEAAVRRGERSARAAMPVLMEALPPERRGGGFSPALSAARKNLGERIEFGLTELGRGVLPPLRTSLLWQADLRLLDEAEGSPLGLDGDRYAGIRVSLLTGKARFELSSLVGMPVSGESWRLSAGFSFQPFDSALVSAEVHGAGSGWSLNGVIPSRAGGAVLARWDSGGERISFVPRAEFSFDYAAGRLAWRGAADLEARLPRTFPTSASFSAGAFIDSSGSEGPEWKARASHVFQGIGRISARSLGRVDLAGGGTAAWPSDAFRGAQTPGTAGLRVVANFEAAWDARILAFDLADSIVVRRIEAGPYLDLEWAGASLAPAAGSAGVLLSGMMSIAGLLPLELSVYAGAGFDGRPVVGIRAGRLFPHAER